MDQLALRTTVLWIHAISGVVWVGASAAFVIAGLATGTSSDEGVAFARRAAPRINRVNMTAAVTLVATGIINVILAGQVRHFRFSSAFRTILTVKILILAAMVVVLASSFRAERMFRSDEPGAASAASRRMVRLFILIVAMGSVALGLGLWLLGS
jgi:hypothetical protein